MYHGWTDPQVHAAEQRHLLQQRGEDRRQRQAANSIALFMMPGMNHCQGGPGTDTFDKVARHRGVGRAGKSTERGSSRRT